MAKRHGNQRLAPQSTKRIRRELKTVRLMIDLYCRAQHATGSPLCDECQRLWDYTRLRVEACPFAKAKPTCANCTVHCFKPQMRDRMRAVMSYAGPKMPLRHPLLSILHVIDGRRPTPSKTNRRPAVR